MKIGESEESDILSIYGCCSSRRRIKWLVKVKLFGIIYEFCLRREAKCRTKGCAIGTGMSGAYLTLTAPCLTKTWFY